MFNKIKKLFTKVGAGSTINLKDKIENENLSNKGFLYIDGKGDYKIDDKIQKICQELGRDEKINILDFPENNEKQINYIK